MWILKKKKKSNSWKQRVDYWLPEGGGWEKWEYVGQRI